MRNYRLYLGIAIFGLLLLACSLISNNGAIDFNLSNAPTQSLLFPSRTANPNRTVEIPTKLATYTPTATQRDWPEPYWGTPGPAQVTPIPTPFPLLGRGDDINILLLGADKKTSSFRTDTIIVANIQPEIPLISMISIPRDLFVYIPGWKMQRINSAFYHGVLGYYSSGPDLLADTILYNLGIEIDFYVKIGFQGLIDMVDTVGEITVPVACSYTDWHIINPQKDDQDEDNWSLYTVNSGMVEMDGDLALWYARSRKRSSDFDRSRRQQEVIRAIFEKALSLQMIAKIPTLYSQYQESFETDISFSDITELLPIVSNLSDVSFRGYFLNHDVVNTWISPQKAYYLLPDPIPLKNLLDKIFSGKISEDSAGEEIVVEIINGSQNQEWDELAAERLSYGGIVSFSNDTVNTSQPQTTLTVTGTDYQLSEIKMITHLLGLNEADVIFEPETSSNINYHVVIGENYSPCFAPATLLP